MPRSLLPLLFSFIICDGFAQFYNWGWGPPISVTQNGSTITCTVWDPALNTSRSQSYQGVEEWSSVDGVVATLSNAGVVQGIVYDVDLSSFRDEGFSFVSNTAVSNADGIVAWVTGSGTVGAAIYDPAAHLWREDDLSFSAGTNIINRHGVVSWLTGSGTVGAAVYDAGTQQWKDDTFSFSAGTTMFNQDGVVAWLTGSGTVGAAVYDPANGQWMDDQFSFSAGTSMVLEDGVVAWRTGSGTIGAAAYNWNSDQWVDGNFSFGTQNTGLGILDGTVHWSNDSGAQKQGFTAAGQWQSDVNTVPRCAYHPVEVGGSGPPHIGYLWCLSIGASSYSHDCGDGHSITRRWAWKQYATPGTYQPELTVLSAAASSTCDGTLNFVGTMLPGTEELGFLASWTGTGVRVTSDGPIGVAEILDASGRLVASGRSSDQHLSLQVVLAPGIYLVQVQHRSVQGFLVPN